MVCQSCEQDHTFTTSDGLAADHRFALRDSEIGLHRTVVAQDLVDRVARPFGLLAQPLHLVGVAHERPQAVADEVRRRFVAGDHDDAEHVRGFGGIDELSPFGFVREQTDCVVGFAARALGEPLAEVPRHALTRDVRGLSLGARRDHLEQSRSFGRPSMPACLLVPCNSEHAKHHPHRHRLRNLADPLHLSPRDGMLDDVVGERLDGRLQRHQPRSGKRARRDLAQSRVLGRVDEQDAVVVRRGWEHARGCVSPARVVGESLVVPRDREHVGVPAQDPAAQDHASVDGAVLAKPDVHGIGVLNGALAQRVVARAVAGTLGDARHERTVAAPSIAIHRGVVAAIHRSIRTGRLASFVGRRAVCTCNRVRTCPQQRMEGMTIHRCRGGARRKRRTDTADPCRRMYAGERGD